MRDHVAQLVLLEAAVDRHRDGAELGRSEEAGHEVELVRHQDPDLVAGADAEPAQRPREAVGQSRKLGKRDPLVGEDDRVPARFRRRPVDEVTDRRRLDEGARHGLILQSLGWRPSRRS